MPVSLAAKKVPSAGRYSKASTIVDLIENKSSKLNSDRSSFLPQINLSNRNTFNIQPAANLLANSAHHKCSGANPHDNNTHLLSVSHPNGGDLRNEGDTPAVVGAPQVSGGGSLTHGPHPSPKKGSHGGTNTANGGTFVDSVGKEGPWPCNELHSFANYLSYLPVPVADTNSLPVFSLLNAYEKSEVAKMAEKDKDSSSSCFLYYFGLRANKVKVNDSGERNYGHDDEHGGYHKVTGDQVLFRYELFDTLGKGSFGQVIRAFDHKDQKFVALKIIRNKRRFHAQALIEVEILEKLRSVDRENVHNIIHLQNWFYFRNHLCITFELLGMNLYELIKINNYQGFSYSLIKRFAHSILQCLVLFSQMQIIHCDLKPENILLQANFKGTSAIKVIDVGSSCFVGKQVYTYIQSRFYRSPEVILGLEYSLPIDMWSFGCILAELFTGYPIFPGENEVEQLNCIMEIFGVPPPTVLKDATRKKIFFDSRNSPRCITNSKGKKRKPSNRTLEYSLKNSNNVEFVDFVRKCLNWCPEERLTPSEALEHPFLLEAREHYRRKKKKQQNTGGNRHSYPQPHNNHHHHSDTLPSLTTTQEQRKSSKPKSGKLDASELILPRI